MASSGGAGFAAPSLSLPKGGGAIRGLGETFANNPVTGTSSLSIPLPLSSGREGFTPGLALSYDSGAGNGPYGLGWSVAIPAITRRTDRGIPRYLDARDSDVFLMSGAEDLVPVLRADGTRHDEVRDGFQVRRYRPRTEGAFARIERWTKLSDAADVHWRSIDRGNTTTLYGSTSASRIADPDDPTRVFSWLAAETFDDRGNAAVYDYVAEDGRGVDRSRPEEATRSERSRRANRYLKRVRYGNRTSRLLSPDLQAMAWLFELVLDYGDHDADPTPAASRPWPARPDPFSTYRAGFEIRTYRRCQRFLMFHRIAELAPGPRLVSVLALDFADLGEISDLERELAHQGSTTLGSFLRRVTSIGIGDGGNARSMPPLELAYVRPRIDAVPRALDAGSVRDLRSGVDGVSAQWVDLDGEGLAGVFSEEAGAWWYKRNLGGGRLDAARVTATQPAVGRRPQFLDLGGDGQLDAVILDAPMAGFYERTADADWLRFVPLDQQPSVAADDPNARLVDLTGDGRADLLIVQGSELSWHEGVGEAGFGERRRIAMPADEDAGPLLVFGDPRALMTFADMSGDGLPDVVRVRNGEVAYWPNLGYGRFGAKIVMDGSPVFDTVDAFDPGRLRLADIDGSGVTDLVYLGRDHVQLYFNRSGNGFTPVHRLRGFPTIDNVASVTVTDLLGLGTACLVWSSALPRHGDAPVRYVDLMGGEKPHLLASVDNHLGARTAVSYASSTTFYLADRAAGRPWTTRLPFPVHVVARTEVFDAVSGSRFTRRFAYHDGFFDGREREFRGFGEVEQVDTEELSALGPATNIDAASHVPPVLTRTRFHTGAERGDAAVPDELTGDELREAVRALKGAMLRQEVFALDGTPREVHPYQVTEQHYEVRTVQRRGANQHAVFFTFARESITSYTERQPGDPRVSQTAALEVDDFGNVLVSVAIAYGRVQVDSTLAAEDRRRQAQVHVTLAEVAVTNAIDDPDAHRTPLPYEARTFELTGLATATRYTLDELRVAWRDAAELAYEEVPAPGQLAKRVIEHTRTRFRADDLTGPLPLAHIESMALPFETYQLALTPGLVASVYADRVSDAMLAADAAYVHSEGDARWWIRSGTIAYAASGTAAQELAEARAHFFVARRYDDPFGHATDVVFDPHDLLARSTRDARGNTTRAEHDYRVLAPSVVTDPNGNRASVAFDAFGLVAATAVMGKVGEAHGDSLDGLLADLPETEAIAVLADPLANAARVLGRATTRFVYDLFAYDRSRAAAQPAPTAVATIAREVHDADLAVGATSPLQLSLSYIDGGGRTLQRKQQAEPGPGGAPRWIASGWTVFDNKGHPVRTFEPFFADSPRYEPDVQIGVATTVFYDPLGRVIGTLHPDHSWARTVFDAWRQETWDANDTVLLDPAADPVLGPCLRRLPASAYLPTWHARRAAGSADDRAVAAKAAAHAGTPAVAHLDALARTFLAIATTGAEQLITRTELDIEGNVRAIVDPLGRICMRYDYDLVGRPLHQASMEAGERWVLPDIAGKPVSSWNSRGHQLTVRYDELQRPRETRLGDLVLARTVYGEDAANPEADNLRGRPIRQFDQAGVVVHARYDFKGNLVAGHRQVARDYRGLRDWAGAVALERDVFAHATELDALNRPTAVTSPDGSVIRPRYNAASLLDAVTVNLRGSPTATPVLAGIEYNARGQRLETSHGNGVVCAYNYDPDTFRLTGAQTTRASGDVLQALRYTYDAVGNIAHLADDAQQTTYFANQVVTADSDYTYDAIYRLIAAAGREHIGQATRPETSADDTFRTHLAHPQDGQAMRRYAETYRYDAAGNLLALTHSAGATTWTRAYSYAAPSQLEQATRNNRLTTTTVGAAAEPYAYDVHGNLTAVPHLSSLVWNPLDQLESTARQTVTAGTAETTFYVYDASGQRARKVTERHAGSRSHERLYFGGFEVFRDYAGDGTTVMLERETLHVSVGSPIALVETRTRGSDPSPARLIRYQLSNHLGSTTLELDGNAQVISYEEYYPYGSTSYQAVRSQTEAPKRYRYTGMERDEETGFAYHSARYYAPWLGRWTSCDPIGVSGGINLYAYAAGNPISLRDARGTDPQPALTKNADGYYELPGETIQIQGTAPDRAVSNFVIGADVLPSAELERETRWRSSRDRSDYSWRIGPPDEWSRTVDPEQASADDAARNSRALNIAYQDYVGGKADAWEAATRRMNTAAVVAKVGVTALAAGALGTVIAPFLPHVLKGMGLLASFGHLKNYQDTGDGHELARSFLDFAGASLPETSSTSGPLFSGAGGAMEEIGLPRGFKNSAQFAKAQTELKAALEASGVTDARIGVRGSAITGQNSQTGKPFGPKSDIDFYAESAQLTEGQTFSPNIPGFVIPKWIGKSFPAIQEWSSRWSGILGRKVSVGGFVPGMVP